MVDKNNKFSLGYKISSIILIIVFSVYSVANIFFQVPLFKFAAGSSWDRTSARDNLEKVANGRVIGQSLYQDSYGNFLNALNKEETGSFRIIKGKNGQLNYADFYPNVVYEYAEKAAKFQRLAQITERNGGQFLYVNAIDSYDGAEDNYGDYPAVDYKYRSDAFNYYLQGLGVNYLDSRDILYSTRFDKKVRYETDIYWTIDAAFTVFGQIIDELETSDDLSSDPNTAYTDHNNYHKEIYDDFVGDLGLRSGIPFTHKEEFVLYTPTFQTNYTMTTKSNKERHTVTGDFNKVFIDNKFLSSDEPYKSSMYNSYLGGQAPQRIIKNNLNKSGKKALIIGDSYMLPISAFMSTGFSELHVLWPYGNSEVQDIEKYLQKNQFDTVIFGLSSLSLEDDNMNLLDGLHY